VGSNPTSSANPLNRLGALIRRLFADEFDSTHDSRTWKLLCFLSLLALVSLVWQFIFHERKSFPWIHARLLCGTRPFLFFATRSRAENMEQAVCQAGDSTKDSHICSLRIFPIGGKGLPLGHNAVWVLTESVYSTQESVLQLLLVRIPDRAETLRIEQSKIYELIATGELPTIHVGRAVRISVSTLQKWVEAREQQGVSG
jgi:excisionase family DNA binding protein